MLEELEEYGKNHPIVVLSIGLAFVAFLGLTDYLTGSELSFSIFYLVPISLVTMMAGRSAGIMISFVSAVVWLFADLSTGHIYSHFLIPYWNASVRLGYFILHTILLSALLRVLHQEKDKSLHDPLTNAANWRLFKEYAHRELTRSLRQGKSLTLAYFDVDNFKHVNDTLGHDVGDELLKVMSDTIQSCLRPSDMLARVGGDEFAILFPDTEFDGAASVLARIRLAALSEMKKYNWDATLSIGAITYNVVPSSIEQMIKRVDELMYSVKKRGKNNLRHESWPLENAGEPII